MTTYVRGAAVKITSTFKDASGSLVTPISATIKFAYQVNGADSSASFSMNLVGSVGTYTWDSNGVDAGDVDWFVTTPAPSSPDQGSFTLAANNANS